MGTESDIKLRLSNFTQLYKKQISRTVTVYVGQEDTPNGRSNYLALYIHKTDTHDLIKLRLSTVRKMVKFLITKKFLPTARRLTLFEKIKLNIRTKKG